ncbi:MAG: GIY-YIG nuclease family protein [Oscillospiraceae bacterium]|nr:GIY-YIG nuclease family protein [Oscillospiraceae bacterium]
MRTPNIRSFEPIVPMIYAYTHSDYFPHAGWTKIGYTEKQSVEERVRQQHQTADIAYQILWRDNAIYKDGSGQAFTDRAFHRWLTRKKGVERRPGTEWFRVDGPRSRALFEQFAQRGPVGQGLDEDYTLREEQARAVKTTAAYFRKRGEEFLWNAKPRFGKTLAAYDLVRRMGFRKVLIVTNRPSIANSWADDFLKFIAWRDELCFVSDSEVMRGHPAPEDQPDLHPQAHCEADGGQAGGRKPRLFRRPRKDLCRSLHEIGPVHHGDCQAALSERRAESRVPERPGAHSPYPAQTGLRHGPHADHLSDRHQLHSGL